MKKLFALYLLIAVLLLSACNTSSQPSTDTQLDLIQTTEELTSSVTEDTTVAPDNTPTACPLPSHMDADDNGRCDSCDISVIILLDLFAINDLHGKFDDTDSNVGVDELSTFIKNFQLKNQYTVLLSSGDMWQGSSESNLTKGKLMTEWMNEMDFVSMTLGNHEYDWGEEYIIENSQLAEFPFLAINVYDRDTNKLVDYCSPSTVVDLGDIQIGIIGAIGDTYSSISAEKSGGFYFKTGSELTALVKAESERLKREEGVDYIIYSIHDGYSRSTGSVKNVSDSEISSWYDSSLSSGGYVDIVFEAHTHKSYILKDAYGVYHFQNGGENNGVSHAAISINFANLNSSIETSEVISYKSYSVYGDHPIVDELLEKYADIIARGKEVLGNIKSNLESNTIRQLVADLYYQFGVETWGDEYDIVLGGGFLNVRSPYVIYKGDVKYSDIQSVLPFDNNLVLCSIKGRDLKSKFFETSNENYFISYGSYGESVKNNIDPNATYYVIVDSYTSTYKYNNLTEIARIDEDLYARDLLAEYIKRGKLS